MSKVPVDAVETSLGILAELEERAPLGVTELAASLDTPKATVYYHLQTLEDHGYVTDGEDGYEIGLRVLELGGRARNRRQLTGVVEPNLQRLGTETNEIAVFAVEERGTPVLLHVERPTGLTTAVDVSVGMHLPVHGSAVGKAQLAAMPAHRRDAILADHGFEAHTAETVTSEAELRDRLETVRSEGHAFDRGEFDPDIHSVAAPVMDESDSVAGAVGIVGPSSRLYSDRFAHELPHLVERFAERIEYELSS
ncbi:IclR family transcriptional regulator [Halosimplex marinum]|uniref:IclR family transcriptional regulator n=1 Tax=Halosimplex marinum TaxID=3396620 RepID=UPI003F56F3BA